MRAFLNCLFLVLPVALLAGLLELPSSSARAPETPGKRYALLVGINVYQNRNLDKLEYAERDASDLADVLKRAGFEVRLLLGSGTGKDQATRANIVAALTDLLKGVDRKDTVLVALAGHGQQMLLKVKREGRDVEREVPFFCPRDAVPADPATLVSLNAIIKTLDEKGGGSNLLLVDACRHVIDPDRGARGGVSGSRIDSLGRGMAVFFACSDRQRARETVKAGGGHGVFFHFVLEGLAGRAKNDRGEVTWDRLVTYVRSRVREAGPTFFPELPEEQRQKPQLIQNLSDDPVLVKPGVEVRIAFSPDLTLARFPIGRVQILKRYEGASFRSLVMVRGNRRLIALNRGNGEEDVGPDDPLTSRPELIVWDLDNAIELHRWTIRSGVA